MARRIAVTNLDASTLDIINVIRANASYEYQQSVPEITDVKQIPKVGEILFGYPALANHFVNSLVNRIAAVKIKSATFNNEYNELKKGYLEFGETVEEVFVSITKAKEFNVEKAESREFKRTLADVRTAFHAMNWQVVYPITIQNEDLRMAFTSAEGVQDLIARIVDAVYTAEQYDEYLLFKYLMIKAIAHGKMYPIGIDDTDMNNSAIAFRGTSNQLQFMSNKYNASGVTTTTPKADQYIFMDSNYNARYDVNVLAAAFNMDRATFSGKLKLIDSWDSFDNARFDEIRSQCDMIEEITDEELALTANVKAVLIDKEWFQVYDNLATMTEQRVSSGLYWNYFYHVWKTVSSSPFSNAIVFVDDSADITAPNTFTATVTDVSTRNDSTVVTLTVDETETLSSTQVNFVQTEQAVEDFVAVHKYGAILFSESTDTYSPVATIGDITYNGGTAVTPASTVGTQITFTKAD